MTETTPGTAPHCFRPVTALDRMIDRAVGQRIGPVRRWVSLVCPTCQRHKRVPMEHSDPPGCVEVRATCPDCEEIESIEYLDGSGQRLY